MSQPDLSAVQSIIDSINEEDATQMFTMSPATYFYDLYGIETVKQFNDYIDGYYQGSIKNKLH